jgi:hypothetical protein
MTAALACLCTTLAAQPNFVTPLPGLVATATGSLVISVQDPVHTAPGKVLVQWEVSGTDDKGFFNVERAAYKDGPFEPVAILRQEASSARFTDEQPLRGNNYYRIKWVHGSGLQQFSKLVGTSFAGDLTCKFYPNPVDNMLIIRSEQPLELILTDQNGKIRTNLKLRSGLQTVDVSALEKGLYIITLTQTETGRVLTEKLVKN